MRGRAPAVLLIGPTASGKSALAMALADAIPGRLAARAIAREGVEIISVDSAQVYRDMNVGTAKPHAGDLAAVPHHLIDILPPTEVYSAARFREDALRLCADITARHRLPLLVGGTMLYFKALREGLSTLPQADPAVRAAIDATAAERGWPALHAELARVDPVTAARLQPADAQRIQRALEIYRTTGMPMSLHLDSERSAESPFRFITLGIAPSDRAVLHQRIERRFEAMLEEGLVDEVRRLKSQYALTAELPSMRSVGYRQAWDFIEGRLDAAELLARGIYATRQLAKRQLTWMRGMNDVTTFDCLAPDLSDQVLAHLGTEFAANPGAHGEV